MEKRNAVPQRYADFARDCREIQDLCRERFDPGTLDLMGWPMNLDSLQVSIGPRTRARTVARAAELYGADCAKSGSDSRIWVRAPYGGQGAGRRRQLEFMEEEFRKRGYDARVHYRDD